jgi:MSHA biogenesis protein MshK
MKKLIWLFMMLLSGLSAALHAELRDPTRPPVNIQGVAAPTLVLNAVLIGPNRRIAIINGLEKRVGQDIAGQYITAIYQNMVQLEGPSGKMTLFLYGKPVRNIQNVCGQWRVYRWNRC